MSGAHRFYTVTGRALPLPPRRTPSRHSSVLRLPTRRAEVEEQTAVRANSPGRIEQPRGGEFRFPSAAELRASQLVVYEGPHRGAATAARDMKPEWQPRLVPVPASSKTSSVVRRGGRGQQEERARRHHGRSNGDASASSTPMSRPSTGGTRPSPTPLPSKAQQPADSAASSPYASGTPTDMSSYSPHTAVSGNTTLTEQSKSARRTHSSSERSSPCINHLHIKEEEQEKDEGGRSNHPEKAAAVGDDYTRSIVLSSTRVSQVRDTPHVPRHRPLSHDSRSSISQHTNSHSAKSSKASAQSWNATQTHAAAVAAAVRADGASRGRHQQATAAAAGATAESSVRSAGTPMHNDNGSTAPSSHRGPLSESVTESVTSSQLSKSSYVSSASQHHHTLQKTSSSNGKAVIPGYAEQGAAPPVLNNLSRHSNSSHASSTTPHPQHSSAAAVARNDHAYSQRKLEERRVSRSQQLMTNASSPAETSTHSHLFALSRPFKALVLNATTAAPAVGGPVARRATALPVQYEEDAESGREAGNADDPLEMNTPIASRARHISESISPHRRRGTSQPGAASQIEGTELLASLPRLQGRSNLHTKGATGGRDDRSYRTVLRFIEYQPERERPQLEAMLQEYDGRESDLCEALAETYGEDFERMKSACQRGQSVPLLAYHDTSASAEEAAQHQQHPPSPSRGGEAHQTALSVSSHQSQSHDAQPPHSLSPGGILGSRQQHGQAHHQPAPPPPRQESQRSPSSTDGTTSVEPYPYHEEETEGDSAGTPRAEAYAPEGAEEVYEMPTPPVPHARG